MDWLQILILLAGLTDVSLVNNYCHNRLYHPHNFLPELWGSLQDSNMVDAWDIFKNSPFEIKVGTSTFPIPSPSEKIPKVLPCLNFDVFPFFFFAILG